MARVGENQLPQAHHLLLFPCPFQGHLNPMLQLATLLHSKGFSITIVHTQFNSPNPSNFSNFHFEIIPDGLSDGLHPMDILSIINVNCAAPFRAVLARMLSDNRRGPITCVITDDVLSFTQSITDSLKVPRIVLVTCNATSYVTISSIPMLHQKGYYPIEDPNSEVPVPEIPPLRVKDLPVPPPSTVGTFLQLIVRQISATRASSGLIFNALDCLEQTTLSKIQQEFRIPVFPIGPLYKFAAGHSGSSSLLSPDHSCMAWLAKQAPKSVIYVSFGSIAAIDGPDLLEMAWGLANSGQPFLWVVRPGFVNGSECAAELPEGFEEETRDRGLVVKWAPQQEVLSHPSVGGFWTHGGWNSTLESVCEGVPMLCWPCFMDQAGNARLVSHVWRVGMTLENGLERCEIDWAIRRLMVGNEGKEMRERIKDLKENVDRSIRKGGSSHQSLDALIDLISSF
ncbi:UDP-glycosyltransferase 76B1-like [Magnolia sinica]|uniref:UDP-glycosyltransferase 76B1-like n=1 Tax=Magnolia sinica TaxID=86752 RepID=UPI00265AFA04|nr:UDP-glycosyltransferase 76B1-like [Magnolia sinica]